MTDLGVVARGRWSQLVDEYPNDFVLGTTKPVAANTGLVSPTTSTVSGADVSYGVNGQVVSDTLFLVNVNVTADFVYFFNCEFQGKVTTTANNIVRANAAGQNGAVFERCKFANRFFPSTDGTAGAHGSLQAHDVTLIRCDMSQAADGLGIITPGGVTAQGCYMHDHWFFSPNSDHLNDGNHCDGVQCHAGVISNVLLEGCNIEGIVDDTLPNSQAGIDPIYSGTTLVGGNSWKADYFSAWDGIYPYPPWATSAVLAGGSGLVNWQLIDGWLDGGGYACVNLGPGITDATSSGIVITGNRVGSRNRDKASNGGRSWLLICSSSLSADLTVSGNTNEDDGTPNNSVRH